MKAKRLIEMAFDTGGHPDFVHGEKRQKFASREHPMAKNPAYPDFKAKPGQKEANWEEVVASKQYQDTLGRIKTFLGRLHGVEPGAEGDGAPELNVATVTGAMFQALKDAMEMERPYRRSLEKLALKLVFEQPEFAMLKAPYEAGEFKIDMKLGATGDLTNAKIGGGEDEDEIGQPDPDLELKAVEKLKGFDPEVEKRKFINAMIAGGSVSKNYAYQLFNDQLTKISPGLPTLYGMVMAGTELGYFVTSDEQVASAVQTPGAAGGSAEMETDGEVPVIKVRAMIFPMLIQELSKGLLELVSYEGLPKEAGRAKEVIDKADLADEEAWAMIMGRGLWMRFVDAIGLDSTDVTLHLYNYLIQLDTEEFNGIMKTIQAGGPEATKVVKGLIDQLRSDIEDEKHGEYKEEPQQAEPEGGEYGLGGDAWKNQ